MSQFAADLETCASEPIHVPGSIQPRGVLLGLDEQWRVTHEGGPIDHFFVRRSVLGQRASDFLPAAAFDTIRNRPVLSRLPGRNARVQVQLPMRTGDLGMVEVSLHRNDQGVFIAEFEAADPPPPPHTAAVDEALAEVVNAHTETAVLDAAVLALRRLTGYDRVIGYLFDQEFNGSVISEAARPGLTSYMHQRFPATDIPPQALRLYRRKRVRLISDIHYRPWPVSAVSDAVQPLDLSDADLRSVSPIHIEYLHNMGVRATLVCSLLRDNDLLGMLACHHLEPRYVVPEIRERAMLIADVTAARLATLRDLTVNSRRVAAYLGHAQLLYALTRDPNSIDELGRHVESLRQLLDATGAAVIISGQAFTAGATPQERDIRELAVTLRSHAADGVASTHHLAALAPEFAHLRDVAAGVIAVYIGRGGQDSVLWFRPEIVASVNWAGNPYKAVEVDEAGVRVSPRRSFETWVELQRDRSMPWEAWEIEIAASVRGSVANIARQLNQLHELAQQRRQAEQAARAHAHQLEAAGRAMAEARDQAMAANRAKSQFLASMSEEIRTPLVAILQSVDRLAMDRASAAPSASTAEDASGSAEDGAREALATIHRVGHQLLSVINDVVDLSKAEAGQLVIEEVEIALDHLIHDLIRPFESAARARGLDLRVRMETAIPDRIVTDPARLRQILMNLVDNAIKFTERGHVELQFSAAPGSGGYLPRLLVAVVDTGIGMDESRAAQIFQSFEKTPTPITRKEGGTGLGIILSRRLARLMGGEVRLIRTRLGEGSTFLVDLPLQDAPASRLIDELPPIAGEAAASSGAAAGASERDAVASTGNAAGGVAAGGVLGSRRVLLAEHDLACQQVVSRALIEAGAVEVKVVDDGRQALDLMEQAMARSQPFDLLITDIQMPEIDGDIVIQRLRQRGITAPIVALTADARYADARWRAQVGCDAHLSKPVEAAAVVRVCAGLLKSGEN